MNYSKEKNRGITLIALVITIIVLLILAGVSIAMLTGENGILTQAQRAKKETEQSKEDELRRLTALEAATNLENTTYIDNSTGEEKTIIIPPGFAVSQVDGENTLKTGLVIIDSNENEYVWIEVPRTAEVYPTAGTNIVDFTNSDYEKIENDLHTYTYLYRNETNYNDVYYSYETTGLSEAEYNSLKKNMLKSVYLNAGFWISRYEIGALEKRTTHTNISNLMPLSQKGLYPLTYVYCKEAEEIAKKYNIKGYSSNIMFGVQWDLVLVYLEKNAQWNISESDTAQKNLMENSTSWGNYYDSTFTLNNGKYAQINTLDTWYTYTDNLNECVQNGTKLSTTNKDNYSILCTTGASNQNCKQNIYDLAGNVWEWTLEYSGLPDNPCSIRGGGFYHSGKNTFASYRSYNPYTFEHNLFCAGFRVTIY